MTLTIPNNMKPSEILYRLRELRTSYAEIDRTYGLAKDTAVNTARRPHPDGELALAEVLGLSPRQIWPSRYDASPGMRLSPQPLENYRTQPILAQRQKVSPEMTCGAAA